MADLSKGVPFNWRKLAEGVYVDDRNVGHIVAAEFLKANGLSDTPENERMLMEMADVVMREAGITVKPGEVMKVARDS